MSVSLEDVRRMALLARVAVTDAQLDALTTDLDRILAHMTVLQGVDVTDTESVESATPAQSSMLRADEPNAVPLERPIASFAPRERDGFFLVPRLASHE